MLVRAHVSILPLSVLFFYASAFGFAQNMPPPENSRESMRREAMLGILPASERVSVERAKSECLQLPVKAPDDRLEGPHGSS